MIQWGSEIRPFEIRRHLKSGLFEGQISNGRALVMAIAIVPTIQNPDVFVRISNIFWQNGGHLSGFQMVGVPDFRCHSKSRLGGITDPPCTVRIQIQTIQIPNPFQYIMFLKVIFQMVQEKMTPSWKYYSQYKQFLLGFWMAFQYRTIQHPTHFDQLVFGPSL